MAEEQDTAQDFEVVDRRRVRSGPDPTTPAPGAAAGSEETQDPEERGNPEELEDEDPYTAGAPSAGGPAGAPQMDFSVTNILVTMVNMLYERAWISMGLMPDPFTEKIQQDLTEARRAIDVVADLVKHLGPHGSPEEQRELQNLLATLRANYVRQVGK